MIGRHAVAENAQGAGAFDLPDFPGLQSKFLEEGRLLDIGAVGVPLIDVARLRRDLVPLRILLGEIAIEPAKHLRLEGRVHQARAPPASVGQMSLRKTSWPPFPFPIGSRLRSMSTRPASANATTSGGDIRKLALML